MIYAAQITQTLTERMATVLREVLDPERKGVRYAAYHDAGIELYRFTIAETNAADAEALSIEIMRRLTQC